MRIKKSFLLVTLSIIFLNFSLFAEDIIETSEAVSTELQGTAIENEINETTVLEVNKDDKKILEGKAAKKAKKLKVKKEEDKKEKNLKKNEILEDEENSTEVDENDLPSNVNQKSVDLKKETSGKQEEPKNEENNTLKTTKIEQKNIEKLDKNNKTIAEFAKKDKKEDDDIMQNSLLVISKKGNLELFYSILQYCNLNINWQDELGMTALLEATKANQEKMVKFLLKRRADPKIVSKNNVSNLRFAVENNNKKLVKLFLKYDLEVGKQDILGETPLLVSVQKNYYEITKLLLEKMKNFDVDMQDKKGKSLLMAAVENNDIKLVKTLLAKNANIWLVNNKNEDAFTIAEKHSNKKLISILKKRMDKERKNNPKIQQWVRKS